MNRVLSRSSYPLEIGSQEKALAKLQRFPKRARLESAEQLQSCVLDGAAESGTD